MKGSNSPVLRAMYIILVPVVALIVLLNSGWLQRYLPAATAGEHRYTVIQYNYYYFDCFNRFLNEHEDELAQLGYDSRTDPDKQYYEGMTTWEEHFMQEAEALMAETAYLYDQALAEGYVFSEEELEGIDRQLEANQAVMDRYGLSAKNFYISYYGAGMTEERYLQELTTVVMGQAYRAHLEEVYTPDSAAFAQRSASLEGEDYQAADLQLITLDALPDRASGEVGSAQLEALESKLEALVQRYEDGTDFQTLQAQFSSLQAGDETGHLTLTRVAGLPEEITAWALTDQTQRLNGDTLAWVDDETGIAWFVLLEGFGESGKTIDARNQLAEEAVAAQLEEGLQSYHVSRNSLGMLIAVN